MEEDPAGCLDTVPGLAECVMTQDACNAEALLATDAPATQRRSEPAVSAAQIRSQAAKAFGVGKSDLTVTVPPAAAASFGATSSETAWTVSSTHMTAGLRPSDGREYEGFQASCSEAIRLSITELACSNRVPDRVIARESAHDSRASW
jgi:hypothetical protein